MELENFKRCDSCVQLVFHFCCRTASKWQFLVWSYRKPTRVWNNSKRWIQEKNDKFTITLELNFFSYEQRRGKASKALVSSSYTSWSFWPMEGKRSYCWTLEQCPNQTKYPGKIYTLACYFIKQPIKKYWELALRNNIQIVRWLWAYTWFFFYLLISPSLTSRPSATLAFFLLLKVFSFWGASLSFLCEKLILIL